jgi:hypothetical protein
MWLEREIAPSKGEFDPPEEETAGERRLKYLVELVLRDQQQAISSYTS